MTKEELLPLIQADRPRQKIWEVISFKPSDRGIEGEEYLVTVRMSTVGGCPADPDVWSGIAEDMPYPLGPAKEIHDAKINKMMEEFREDLKKHTEIINKNENK